MRVFAISDLHLALSKDKPMDIFGPSWENYMQHIPPPRNMVVAQDDLVLLPGDLSWATYLDDSKLDFMYLDSLPGNKIISKGNHDYWWTTHSKLSKYLKSLTIENIAFLQNNAYFYNDFAVVGTRGWKNPNDDGFNAEDDKIYNRELERLKLSLNMTDGFSGTKIAMLHYPPFSSKGEPTDFVDVMQSFGVNICVYGHLHGKSCIYAIEGLVDGIRYHLVSADYLKFEPLFLGEW
jgi:predicted phosphohydrolase